MIFDVEALGLEEALLDGNPPGAVVGVAITLQTNGFCHLGAFLVFYAVKIVEDGRTDQGQKGAAQNAPKYPLKRRAASQR